MTFSNLQQYMEITSLIMQSLTEDVYYYYSLGIVDNAQ